MSEFKFTKAKAFAPASVGNVGVGFDTLGHALIGAGDTVTARVIADELCMGKVSGCVSSLPEDPQKNTAGKAVIAMLQHLNIKQGLVLDLDKGIDLGSGMGGSAASAVAAVTAVNALLEKPLEKDLLYQFALKGEEVASGAAHGDNVAPSLYGGLVLLAGKDQRPQQIHVSDELFCVCIHPRIHIKTIESRKVLPQQVKLQEMVEFGRNLAGMVLGCSTENNQLIKESLQDNIIEPARKSLIPGFDEIKSAALKSNALGCSISGSGPSIFAWISGETNASCMAEKMVKTARQYHHEVDILISRVGAAGACVLEQN
ncbi:MAG: homoserine kinase [bacterium]